jgi:hypothetical protein
LAVSTGIVFVFIYDVLAECYLFSLFLCVCVLSGFFSIPNTLVLSLHSVATQLDCVPKAHILKKKAKRKATFFFLSQDKQEDIAGFHLTASCFSLFFVRGVRIHCTLFLLSFLRCIELLFVCLFVCLAFYFF